MAGETQSPFPPGCARKYSHVRPLSSGGFGAVHIATQRDLDRKVAIKLLNTGMAADPEQLERFRIEAKATAALGHESIVIVHDHDVEDGVAWIAYELLPGPDLRDILKKGAMTWQDTVRLGIQLAGALSEAHGHGILHRDVKPENVIQAEPGRYKITDFGIARWREGGIKTQHGMILGTPRYMAPEVIRCNEVSAASDIYALGVMLFEVFTGRPPFLDAPGSRLFSQHLTEAPPHVRDLRADLPAGADDIFVRALEKDPENRFVSMKEFRERLEAERDESLGEFRAPVQKVTAPTSRTRLGPPSSIRQGRSGVSSVSTRVFTQPDPSGAVSHLLHEIRPWKLIAAMLAVGGAIGAGVMVTLKPAPTAPVATSTAADPVAEPSSVTPEVVLRKVAARLDETLPEMVEVCRTLHEFNWRQHDKILGFIEGMIPRIQQHRTTMQDLIKDLPADTVGLEKLTDEELRLLSRIRAWQFISFHRLAGLADIVERYNTYSSFFRGGKGSSKDENWIGDIQRHLRGAVHGEREGSLLHMRVLSLQQEQLRRVVAAPDKDAPILLSILEDLAHVAHPYRLSSWRHRGEDHTGKVMGEFQTRMKAIGEKDATPVGDLVRIVWESHLDPPHKMEMEGLRAARQKTVEALLKQAPAWKSTVEAIAAGWKLEAEKAVALQKKEDEEDREGDDDGRSFWQSDRGNKRVWGVGWTPRGNEGERRSRDRGKGPGKAGEPSPSASPGPR